MLLYYSSYKIRKGVPTNDGIFELIITKTQLYFAGNTKKLDNFSQPTNYMLLSSSSYLQQLKKTHFAVDGCGKTLN